MPLFADDVCEPSQVSCYTQSRSTVSRVYDRTTFANQARSPAIHSHGRRWIVCMTGRRLWTKPGLPLYTVTVDRESCVWQQGSTLRWRQQNRIVRAGKSEAKVTNNKKLRSMHCTIEANYWQKRSVARFLCDSRATCEHHLGPVAT